MIQNINLEDILFLDIETVPETQNFSNLTPEKQELWALKTQYQRKEDITPEDFYERSGIWAEFGKIVCISIGFFKFTDGDRHFRVTSLFGEEEKLLKDFKLIVETHFNHSKHLLCAHNGKEFDFPFIARRMIINSIPLPSKLSLFGKKPWEIPYLDTLDLWKFGDYKNFTSLQLLTNVLGIPSPKDDINGSEVYRVYYEEKALDRLVKYWETDTIAVAQIILRRRGEIISRAS